MKSKSSYLIVIVVLALLGSLPAGAATRTWDHEGLDHRWDTAANWSNDKIPVVANGDTARVIGADYALIDKDVTAAVKVLQVGWGPSDGSDPQAGELRMTGGSLSWTAASRVGQRAPGLFTMEAGAINSTHNFFIGDDPGGLASFLVTGMILKEVSSRISTQTPPRPNISTGPNWASRDMPIIISMPGGAILCTDTP